MALLLIALLPTSAMAASAAATAVQRLLQRGETAAAVQRAERALADDARDAEVRFLLGVAWMDLGRDAEALAGFARLAEDFPELPDPWNNIALLHARAGRLELARQALETALRNDPGHRTARINLGHIHLQLAAQAWEQAAAAAPLESALQQRLDAVRLLLRSPAPGR